jgi:hypothetical protein
MDTTTIHYTDRIEGELSRLRTARPAMDARIEKAEALLVAHMSVASSMRPIRVIVHAGGSRSYRVRSGSKRSKTYTVESESFRCPCPATKPCYHALACYVLDRVLFPVETVPATKRRTERTVRPTAEIAAGLSRMAG